MIGGLGAFPGAGGNPATRWQPGAWRFSWRFAVESRRWVDRLATAEIFSAVVFSVSSSLSCLFPVSFLSPLFSSLLLPFISLSVLVG